MPFLWSFRYKYNHIIVPGIITKGSSHKYNYYIKSYQVLSSRDGKNWKVYKSNNGENKVRIENIGKVRIENIGK